MTTLAASACVRLVATPTSGTRMFTSYLPCNLGPHVYEMVLYKYLKTDAKGFLVLVKEWRQPNLYNIAAVVNAVLNHLLVSEGDPHLMEAQAILYGYEGRYDKALGIYLKGVFEMIKENKLYGVVHGMIVDHMAAGRDEGGGAPP